MPNIHGLYSLGEVALEINASSAWINKIQKRTGIVQKDGASGKISYFDKEEIEILRKVKLLRVLEYTLEDIKELYNQEREMMELVVCSSEPEPEGSEERFIFFYPYGYSGSVTVDFDGDHVCTRLKREEMEDGPKIIDGEKYNKMANSIKATFREVTRRARRLQADLKPFL